MKRRGRRDASKARTALALVAVWAATVVGVAVVTSRVVGAAGRDVFLDYTVPAATQGPSSGPGNPRHREPDPNDAEWQPGSPGPVSPSTAGTPRATQGPTSPPPRDPTPSASPTGHSPGGAGSHHGSAPPSQPTSGPTTSGPRVASWHGAAGTVTVSCQSGRASLLGATPSEGYRVEVETEDEVRVTFEREEPEDELRVSARCVDGIPDFTVDGDSDRARSRGGADRRGSWEDGRTSPPPRVVEAAEHGY